MEQEENVHCQRPEGNWATGNHIIYHRRVCKGSLGGRGRRGKPPFREKKGQQGSATMTNHSRGPPKNSKGERTSTGEDSNPEVANAGEIIKKSRGLCSAMEK